MSKKEAYRQKIEAQVEEQKAELMKLKARAKKNVAEGRISAHEQIEQLEAHLDGLKDKLKDLRTWATSAGKNSRMGLKLHGEPSVIRSRRRFRNKIRVISDKKSVFNPR